MNAAILCSRQWIREGVHSQVEAVSPFLLHIFDLASERAKCAFMCAFRLARVIFSAQLRKTVLAKYSSG